MLVLAFAGGMTLSCSTAQAVSTSSAPLSYAHRVESASFTFAVASTAGNEPTRKPPAWFAAFTRVGCGIESIGCWGLDPFQRAARAGLRRFAGDCGRLRNRCLGKSANGWLHGAAAVTALGLVAGYYVRGFFVMRSAAGWASNSLVGRNTARALLACCTVCLAGVRNPDSFG